MRFDLEKKITICVTVMTLMVVAGINCLFGQAEGARSQIIAHLSGAAVPSQGAGGTLAPAYSLLYSFSCGPDGANPQSGLVRDSAGNLYGTTSGGGTTGSGTVFKITPTGTETILHSFSGQPDGSFPTLANVALDRAGNVYGVTFAGGQFGVGVVFKVTLTGQETVLHSFTGGLDGGFPEGGLVRDGATGYLYGTTSSGGEFSGGTVFKITPAGKETVIYNFGSSPNDGALPTGGLKLDAAGNLYGTTESGGPSGNGTVFELSPSGTETILHVFAGYPSDGAEPYGGSLLRDSAGNIYGVTYDGGPTGDGVVFMLTPSGTESGLLNFNGSNRGGQPMDGLVEDSSGNLYGTTIYGGSACEADGCGVLFKLSPTGKETVLHNFAGGPNDGEFDEGGVIRVGKSIYGTLLAGGASSLSCGAVFKYTP